MDRDEYFRQIARLQNAMIEGKIDRETYERFQAELKEAVEIPPDGAPRTEDDFLPGSDVPCKGQPTPLSSDDVRESVGEQSAAATGPVEPPAENPFKRPPTGTRIERPPLPPDLFEDDDFADDRLKSVADDDEAADDAVLRIPPRTSSGPSQQQEAEPDLSLSGVLFRQAATITADGKAVSLAVEVATYCALVVILPQLGPGMRLQALIPVLGRGAVYAAIGGGLALVWAVAMKTAETIKLHLKNPDYAMLLKFVRGVLLATAGLFWAMIGMYLGEQVGRIVGGRFGFVTESTGSLVGMLLGCFQAVRKLQARKE